jgi:hypothetical protein
MNLTMAQIWSVATSLVQGRGDYLTSELSLYANLAAQDVGTRIRFAGHEAVATSSITSGAYRVPLPTDFGYALSVSNLSVPTDLQQRDPTTFDSRTTTNATPQYFGMYNSWMEIWPSANTDATLQMRYVTAVPEMVSSASTPAIDARWHVGIAYKTAELLAAARNDLEAEAVCRARYLSYMGSTPSDLAYRQQAKAGMSVSIPLRQ